MVVDTYKGFIENIDELRSNVAIFRKVVLHCHSTDSHDFGKSIIGDPSETKYKTEEEFSREILKINLDLAVISDHIKCGLACHLSSVASTKGICILPGMEISLRFPPPQDANKLHLLVIFPEGHSPEKITKIIPPGLPDESSRTGKETFPKDLKEFVDSVHECGGICIAAHVDSNNGLRKNFRQLGEDGIVFHAPEETLDSEQEKKISEDFKEWLLNSGLNAIEVSKTEDKIHYRWVSEMNDRKVSVATVLRNDAHRIEEIDISTKINYIKMAKVCYDDLKLALAFPLTRIRFHDDLPDTPCPRILGMEIIGAEDQGFFNELKIAFSDNLTCLIGPRGSGKSTIIESIRYTFGLNKYLKDLKNASKELAGKATDLQKATLSNCMIRIAYFDKNGQIYILETAYDHKQDFTTKVYGINGEVIEVQDIEDNFPLRLFGWSEIETLGREASRQRDLLDQMIPGFKGDTQSRTETRAKLSFNKAEIDSSLLLLNNILNKDNEKIRKYKEYKADFDILNKTDIQNIFKEIDIVKVKIAALAKLKLNLQQYLNETSKLIQINILEDIDDIILKCNYQEIVNSWWNDEEQKPKYLNGQKEINGKVSEIIVTLETLIGETEAATIQYTDELHEKEKSLREEIGEEDVTTLIGAERRTIAKERLEEVEELRREYFDELSRFNVLLGEWKGIASELSDIQKSISDKRNKRKEEIGEQLNRFSNPGMKISILFSEGYDRKEFVKHLLEKGILTGSLHGQWKANMWPQRIAFTCTPVEMADNLLDSSKDSSKFVKSVNMGTYKIDVDQEIADKLISTLHPFGEDTDAEVPIIDKSKIDKILAIAEVEWDDVESILLNDKPVESCSPGQRSSAMLPLIALVEDIPLIIDQPEDNLDNRLVGKMLVDIIAGLKEHRQIIVSTHNPNIVVSGDAEQVIVLNAESDTRGKLDYSGSIDNDMIVKSIIDLMEGGEEAFINRSRRYHIE